ncbi:MAG: leucine zipper domain-containing protein [Candidatus Zixiibacteriota bacterium]
MDERIKFIGMYLEEVYTMTTLCLHFGISRKTGYKWLNRYRSEGAEGLNERSRAPYHQARKTPPEIEAAILAAARSGLVKKGPKKVRRILELTDPAIAWPAVSTIGAILKRHGLVVPRKRRRKSPPYEYPLAGCDYPNAVWSADLKGWFLTRNGDRCDPLTITDNYSRYILRCQLVRPATHHSMQPVFEHAFREFGVPVAIRTDNGAPFATTAVGGLSRLSVWWIRLGIIPERIMPGKPQQNPRHERMHRTLKHDTCKPPQSTWERQQAVFDQFCYEFNHERPHESIDQRFPAELYQSSPRPYPEILPEMGYPDDMVTRKVHHQGDIKWKGKHLYLTEILAGQTIGLRQVTEQRLDIYFGPIRLAQLDVAECKIIHLRKTKKRYERNK